MVNEFASILPTPPSLSCRTPDQFFLEPTTNQHIIYHPLAPLSSFPLLGILRPASACPSGFNHTEQRLLIVPRRISRSPTGVSSDPLLSPVMPCYANRITGLSGPTSRNTERRNGTITTNVWMTSEPNLCIFSQILEGSFLHNRTRFGRLRRIC